MGFMDAYKRLEKLCGEVMDDERRISAYIDEMYHLPRGAYYVRGWEEDLKQLKHYRWVRNQIVHDPNCTEENMCDPEDTQWLLDFHTRILKQTDPLALYYKETDPRPKSDSQKTRKSRQADKKPRSARRVLLWIFLILALLSLVAWIVWGNTALQLNTITVSSSRLPQAFDGYRIAQVSDLHNAQMGEDNWRLRSELRAAKPDIIVITGDLVDSRKTDIDIALEFVKVAVRIAPCYYVTGNHEARLPEYEALRTGLQRLGVVVLEDEEILLKRRMQTIALLGVSDPSFETDYLFGDAAAVMDSKLQSLRQDEHTYTVLLSHRPELFEVYVSCGVDLALTGHAHGGQFRLPFIGGLAAPNQGLFPKYDAGLYTEGDTNMIVSRGIGNSVFPFRFNNRPEVVLIQLTRP